MLSSTEERLGLRSALADCIGVVGSSLDRLRPGPTGRPADTAVPVAARPDAMLLYHTSRISQ